MQTLCFYLSEAAPTSLAWTSQWTHSGHTVGTQWTHSGHNSGHCKMHDFNKRYGKGLLKKVRFSSFTTRNPVFCSVHCVSTVVSTVCPLCVHYVSTAKPQIRCEGCLSPSSGCILSARNRSVCLGGQAHKHTWKSNALPLLVPSNCLQTTLHIRKGCIVFVGGWKKSCTAPHN